MADERLKQDINPFKIAKLFDVPDSFVAKVFDKKKASLNDVMFLCNFFHIDVDDYFYNQKDKYIKGKYGNANKIPLKFDLEAFANNFKTLRVAKGYTLQDVADSIFCDVRNIQYYEAAQRTPTVDRLLEIANFFQVPVSYLLYK